MVNIWFIYMVNDDLKKSGWWFQPNPTPLKNMKVSWDDSSQLNGKS